ITVTAGAELSKFALGPVLEPVLVLGITIGGCFAGYEVIRRVPLLRPLFGLPYKPGGARLGDERRGLGAAPT
ncbi:MAG: hypothetical protein R3358_04045, partial [Woeseiaceae bacterium]|nr:hypothetical protein [Woeseiaceae bacterium]